MLASLRKFRDSGIDVLMRPMPATTQGPKKGDMGVKPLQMSLAQLVLGQEEGSLSVQNGNEIGGSAFISRS